jgi:AcrR family transcriptional regulator
MVSTHPPRRRRLSPEHRRAELLRTSLQIIGTQPWDEVSMADIAAAAGASKPLLYHYFATKSDLYLAAVRSAAAELREATKPDPVLPVEERLLGALRAHVDWIDVNALAYRAVLHGGISADPDVQAIVEESRADVVARLADAFGIDESSPATRIALRGWVGFLESACLSWITARDLPKPGLVRLLAGSVRLVLRAGEIGAAEDSPPAA